MTKFVAAAITALVVSPAFAGDSCPSTCQGGASVVVENHTQATTVSHQTEAEQKKDIVDTAAGLKDFSTLVAAVKAAGLVDALKGEGPFTVFAPSNEAFAKLPAGTVEELLKPENKEKLTNILLYHVVPAKVMAADVVKVDSADTLLKDKKVKVTVKDGKVFINDSQVVTTDVEVANGVIHVVDTVILP